MLQKGEQTIIRDNGFQKKIRTVNFLGRTEWN